MFLCLPVRSDVDIFHPDVFIIDLADLSRLTGLLECTARLGESQMGFRHLEIDFEAGIWASMDDADNCDLFQTENPVTSGKASDYNDDADMPPLEGFSVRASAFGNLEFRCYESDTGIYFWTDMPVRINGHSVFVCSQAYNLRTGELTDC